MEKLEVGKTFHFSNLYTTIFSTILHIQKGPLFANRSKVQRNMKIYKENMKMEKILLMILYTGRRIQECRRLINDFKSEYYGPKLLVDT